MLMQYAPSILEVYFWYVFFGKGSDRVNYQFLSQFVHIHARQ